MRAGARRRAHWAIEVPILAIGLVVLMAVPALADHLQPAGMDSVDGGEIRVQDGTKYDGARTRAADVWNAVGRINILADDLTHVCDLKLMDVSYPSSFTPYAVWEYNSGTAVADHLHMNLTKLDPLTPDSRRTNYIRHTMVHEYGHALGIDDHTDPKWLTTALMYYALGDSNDQIQAPLAHDEVDYNALW